MISQEYYNSLVVNVQENATVYITVNATNSDINRNKSDINISYSDTDNCKSDNKVFNKSIIELEAEKAIKKIYTPKKIDTIKLSEKYNKLGNRTAAEYYTSKAARLRECSSFLKFAKYENKIKLIQTNSCHVRLCPMCAYKRSLNVYRNVREIYDYINKSGTDNEYIFITLTLKNVAGIKLSDEITKLNKNLTKLLRKKEFAWVLGSVRSIEITYNKIANTYHPHIHCLLQTEKTLYYGRNYISFEKLRNMWAQSCGVEYEPQVNIKRFRPKNEATAGKELAEIAKYSVKPSDYMNINKLDVIETLDNALHQRKLITMTKSFREAKKALKIQDIEKDDFINDMKEIDKNAEYILYKWHFDKEKYIIENL